MNLHNKIKDLVEAMRSKGKKSKMAPTTVKLAISGMSCGGCVGSVKGALENVQGVLKAIVDLESKTATVTVDANVAVDDLIVAVKAKGKEAKLL